MDVRKSVLTRKGLKQKDDAVALAVLD